MNHSQQGEWVKHNKKQGEGSEPSIVRGVCETQQSREREVNHPQQGEWVKNIRKQGGRSEPSKARGVGEKHQKAGREK